MDTFGLAGGNFGESFTASMASKDAARATAQVQAVKNYIRILEANIAKNMMISEALWELMHEKMGLTVEDLHKKLYEIDMRDGAIDGKNQRKAIECPRCSHTVSPRHPACIYCGQIIDDSVFTIS